MLSYNTDAAANNAVPKKLYTPEQKYKKGPYKMIIANASDSKMLKYFALSSKIGRCSLCFYNILFYVVFCR